VPRRPRSRRITDRCFALVIRDFLASPKWTLDQDRGGYSPATKDVWRRALRVAEDGIGAVSIHDIRPAVVQAMIDQMAGLPGKQTAVLSALRQLEKWALVRDLLPQHITTGIEYERSHDGHKPWSDEQVQLAELHARPELARVITLGANTGQRGSDLVRMRWTDLETYNGREGINVTQQKTGRQLWIPITNELGTAMSTWQRRPGFILLRPTGIPWTRKALTWAWISERDKNPCLTTLAGFVLHGLRATACVRLLRAGANTRQIADMVGMSEEIVGRYCRFSVQRENASAAVLHLDRTFGERGRTVARKPQQ
jgi:site-specific recombinase XerD